MREPSILEYQLLREADIKRKRIANLEANLAAAEQKVADTEQAAIDGTLDGAANAAFGTCRPGWTLWRELALLRTARKASK